MQNATYVTRPSPLKSDNPLTPYSHSILSAANMCPMWGVIRYGLRKTYESDARAMALEFGAAAHEVFAAIYLWQVGYIQNLPEHMHYHARRIYRDDKRFIDALKTTDAAPDDRDRLISLGFNILHSGDFYDDPYDNIRTISNLELGIIKYVDMVINDLPRWPIWIEDPKSPESRIGIELSIDIELERRIPVNFKLKPEGRNLKNVDIVRYIGQIDRLHEIVRDSNQLLVLGENKTGSRLDSAWSLAFDLSHQITGYLVGVYTLLGRECTKSRVHGLKSRQTGHSEDFSPISPQERTTEMFETFIDWAIDAKNTYALYTPDFESSPRYTHSCNRYFRPCSLIPFCQDTKEGRIEQLAQMVDGELSPSEQAVMDRISHMEI